MSFMLFSPLLKPDEEIVLTCDYLKLHDKPMQLMKKSFSWMDAKYGKNMQPWQTHVSIKNTESNAEGQFRSFNARFLEYHYAIRNRSSQQVVERFPTRKMTLENPNRYVGLLGAQDSPLYLNTDRVWFCNGIIYKADGNFLNNFFFTKLGQRQFPISIGSRPDSFEDFQKYKSAGITAILNIMD